MRKKVIVTAVIVIAISAIISACAPNKRKSAVPTVDNTPSPTSAPVIVLDAGHGKSSQLMTDEEKAQNGWVFNSETNGWGEWRHFKYGASSPDCEGTGCSKRTTQNGGCWYPIENGDRDIEGDINLRNCIAAKTYLESMGYRVRLSRSSSDENPSITRRLSYCYPSCDTSLDPDAAAFVCIHSNAGGGEGTAYIVLDGYYDQPLKFGSDEYVKASNTLGRCINDTIAEQTPLNAASPITFEPELIALCKSPIPCAYLEIGFFDNPSDFEVLTSQYDDIGKAIASGIDAFFKEYAK